MKPIALLSIVLSLCVCGCDTVKPPREIPADKVGAYPRNVAVEPFLENDLVVGQPRVNEGSSDQPMSVVQPIRNLKDDPLKLQYQFVFMDRTGRPIEGTGGWKYMTIESRVERFLEGAALDTNAADWRLNVRKAR